MVYFSIIVPIYKVEKYISQCIESVLSQSYKDFELILVDDGSPDECPEICNQYVEKYPGYVKVIHKENGGLSDARNAGIHLAAGKYILFLDGDDYWDGDFLKELEGATTSNADIIWGNGLINEYGDSSFIVSYDFKEQDFIGKSTEEVLLAIVNPVEPRWTVVKNIYKVDFLKNNRFYFKKGILCEDAEWTYRIALHAQSFGVFEKIFYRYRCNREGSIMSGISYKRWHDFIMISEEWITRANLIKNSELAEKLKRVYINNCFIFFYEIALFSKVEKEKAIQIVKNSQFFKNPYEVKHKKFQKRINKFGFKWVLWELKILTKIRKNLSIIKSIVTS